MADIKETTVDHVLGEEFATFFSSEYKWINHIQRLKKQFPDEVDIRHVNSDGSLVVHIPAAWVKIKPKKKVVLTEEQIQASKERLKLGRMKRLGRSEDVDAPIEHGRNK